MEDFFYHYAASERLYTAMVTPVCEKHGLTYMEFTVLLFLANNPSFDTASDLVKYRHLTKSHVSMTVRTLQEKGLVKGSYRQPNRRTVHLTLLEKADRIVSDGKAAQKAFGQVLFSGFSDSECRALTSFMARIDQNILHHIKTLQCK